MSLGFVTAEQPLLWIDKIVPLPNIEQRFSTEVFRNSLVLLEFQLDFLS